MSRYTRVIVIVCDGLGVGAAPDAGRFGDADANTLGHVLAAVPTRIPTLLSMGLGRVIALAPGKGDTWIRGAYGKMAERSAGKDTTTGHWELMGLVTHKAFPTYPDGFPAAIIQQFESAIGRQVLGNKAASGTEILRELGERHLATGEPIVYTSADSVFQIAAHEGVIPLEDLYRMCRLAYEIVCRGAGLCRVIARPFVGSRAADFKRTPNRRDFALPPHGPTVLDALQAKGYAVVGIGKIEDIFSGQGLTTAEHTRSDAEGFERTLAALSSVSKGLIFTNLVDFDTLYGHRNDAAGFAHNLEALDERLPRLLAALRDDDLLVITADHGGDPTDPSTDHSREHVPLICFSPGMRGSRELGARSTFADLAATLAENFLDQAWPIGTSFLEDLRAT
ncbi:MAG: phosphopentomutase [Vicinamibacteria bacterium]|jgi:phosphopentomutase|nr:phosphopentomutase [Vicinamibacteria bacterium]